MEKKKWWEHAICYEIYVPSFQDSNNDGIGDLPGICQRLIYLKEIGIDAIWLTPFYPSPKVDNGYDVSDYCNVDPLYGTLTDFDELIKKASDLGIKIIIDLVLNHTSSEHYWFQSARKSKESEYRDYYFWREQPANNWESYFGGSAWEFDKQTGEYYYHAFAKEQVDLNWQNSRVKSEFYAIFDFWIARGVSGFRLDVINFLSTDEKTFNQDNPFSKDHEQEHLYDQNHPNIYPLLHELTSYIKHQNEAIFLIGEVGSEDIGMLFNYTETSGLDVIFNFNLGSIEHFDINTYYLELKKTYEKYKNEKPVTLFFSSHDMRRAYSRLAGNEERTAKLLLAIQLLLKGVPFIYYGEEIGAEDVTLISISDIQDIQGKQIYAFEQSNGTAEKIAMEKALRKTRDYSRGIMQWEPKEYYGFSDVSPWMKAMPRIVKTVIDEQRSTTSILTFFKEITYLRKSQECFEKGAMEQLELKGSILSFERVLDNKRITIILNFGTEKVKLKKPGNILYTHNVDENTIYAGGIVVYEK